jgi:hypothetical protein
LSPKENQQQRITEVSLFELQEKIDRAWQTWVDQQKNCILECNKVEGCCITIPTDLQELCDKKRDLLSQES